MRGLTCLTMLCLAVGAWCVGCGPAAAPPPVALPPAPAAKLPKVTIYIDSELEQLMRRAIGELGPLYHLDIQMKFGPADKMAEEIASGAPADLFLTGSAESRQMLHRLGLVAYGEELVGDALMIFAPARNPAKVKKPEDLLSPKVQKIALTKSDQPSGRLADQALARLGLLEKLEAAGKILRGDTLDDTLSYIESGEAQAGIGYSAYGRSEHDIDSADQLGGHGEIAYTLLLLQRSKGILDAVQCYNGFTNENAGRFFEKEGYVWLSRPKPGTR